MRSWTLLKCYTNNYRLTMHVTLMGHTSMVSSIWPIIPSCAGQARWYLPPHIKTKIHMLLIRFVASNPNNNSFHTWSDSSICHIIIQAVIAHPNSIGFTDNKTKVNILLAGTFQVIVFDRNTIGLGSTVSETKKKNKSSESNIIKWHKKEWKHKHIS